MRLTPGNVTARLRETWPDLDSINVAIHEDGVDIRMPAGPTTRGEPVQRYIADQLHEIDGNTYELAEFREYRYDGPRLLLTYHPRPTGASRRD